MCVYPSNTQTLLGFILLLVIQPLILIAFYSLHLISLYALAEEVYINI